MGELTMTPLRKNALSLLSRIPEEQLTIVIRLMQSMNCPVENETSQKERRPGAAEGKFLCPEDIDADNALIADWFEGTE